MVGLARHPSRMKARITTASAGRAAAIIRYKRVGALRTRKFDYSEFSIVRAVAPLYFTPRISPRFRWKVDYLTNVSVAIKPANSVKFYLRSQTADYRKCWRVISECLLKKLRNRVQEFHALNVSR